jgi:hypothetical protein
MWRPYESYLCRIEEKVQPVVEYFWRWSHLTRRLIVSGTTMDYPQLIAFVFGTITSNLAYFDMSRSYLLCSHGSLDWSKAGYKNLPSESISEVMVGHGTAREDKASYIFESVSVGDHYHMVNKMSQERRCATVSGMNPSNRHHISIYVSTLDCT